MASNKDKLQEAIYENLASRMFSSGLTGLRLDGMPTLWPWLRNISLDSEEHIAWQIALNILIENHAFGYADQLLTELRDRIKEEGHKHWHMFWASVLSYMRAQGVTDGFAYHSAINALEISIVFDGEFADTLDAHHRSCGQNSPLYSADMLSTAKTFRDTILAEIGFDLSHFPYELGQLVRQADLLNYGQFPKQRHLMGGGIMSSDFIQSLVEHVASSKDSSGKNMEFLAYTLFHDSGAYIVKRKLKISHMNADVVAFRAINTSGLWDRVDCVIVECKDEKRPPTIDYYAKLFANMEAANAGLGLLLCRKKGSQTRSENGQAIRFLQQACAKADKHVVIMDLDDLKEMGTETFTNFFRDCYLRARFQA